MLLANFADIHQAQETRHSKALQLGCGHLAIAELLLSKGAEIGLPTANGVTPLLIVVQDGRLAIAVQGSPHWPSSHR